MEPARGDRCDLRGPCPEVGRCDPEAPDVGLSHRGSFLATFFWLCNLWLSLTTLPRGVLSHNRCVVQADRLTMVFRAPTSGGDTVSTHRCNVMAQKKTGWDSLDKQGRPRAHGAFQIGNAASGDRREDETNGGSASGKGGNSRHRLGTSPPSQLSPRRT